MEFFASNLKLLRERDGIKQYEMSVQLGFNQSTWNNYERGVSRPGLEDFVRISKYFGVTEYELLHVDLKEGNLISYQETPENTKKGKLTRNGMGNLNVKKYPKNEQSSVVNDGPADYKITEGIKEKDMLQLIELLTNLSMKISEYIDTNKKVTELEIRLTQIEKLLIKPKK